MNMELRDPNTGQIKTWVWAIVGVGALVLVYIVTKTMGTSTSNNAAQPIVNSGDGQSSDISSLLGDLQTQITDLANLPGVPGPAGPPGERGEQGEPGTPGSIEYNDVILPDTGTLIPLPQIIPEIIDKTIGSANIPPAVDQPPLNNPTDPGSREVQNIVQDATPSLAEFIQTVVSPIITKITSAGTAITGGSGGTVTSTVSTPAPSASTPVTIPYTIQSRETFNQVAAKFGMTWDQLKALNPSLAATGHPNAARSGGRVIQVYSQG